MTHHKFNVWLTVEEASAYLSGITGDVYTDGDLWQAVRENYITSHYRPKYNCRLGVYKGLAEARTGLSRHFKPSAETRWPIDRNIIELHAEFFGPVPFFLYWLFEENYRAFQCKPEKHITDPIGITLLHGTEELACYQIGESGQPESLSGQFDVLLHINDLKKLVSTLPDFHRQEPIQTFIYPGNAPGESTMFAQSSATPRGTFDNRVAAGSPSEKLKKQADPEYLQKAMGIAVHLISELSDQLDLLNKDKPASQRKGLKRAGKPNKLAIAKAMSKKAQELKLEGHGSGHRGFEEIIRKALQRLE